MNEYFGQIKVFPVPLQCEQNMTTMSAFVCVITQRRKYKQQIPSVIHKSQKNITSLLWDSSGNSESFELLKMQCMCDGKMLSLYICKQHIQNFTASPEQILSTDCKLYFGLILS